LELRGLSCTSCMDQLCKHFAMNPATFTFLEARPSATPGTLSAAGADQLNNQSLLAIFIGLYFIE